MLPGVKRKKMEINIFRDGENYVQIGGAPGTAGFWNFVDERLFFYHDRNDPDFTLSVLFHEFTHLLAHLIQPKFCHPIWCNEGLAEYFGASKVVKNKLVLGGMQEGRLVAMAKWREEDEDNDYTLEELMKVPAGSFGGLEYGWAWSFVHFMMESPKYKKKFMKYYVGLAKNKGIKRERTSYYYPSVSSKEDIKWFKKCFGVKNLDELNIEWHAYIDCALKVTSASGYLYEAKVLHRKGKYKKALAALKTAEEKWKGDPSPLVYHYRGLCFKERNKYGDARDAFLKAIEIDPVHGWYYYYLGDVLEEMNDKDVLSEAIRFKKLALELLPDDWTLRNKVERDQVTRGRRTQ